MIIIIIITTTTTIIFPKALWCSGQSVAKYRQNLAWKEPHIFQLRQESRKQIMPLQVGRPSKYLMAAKNTSERSCIPPLETFLYVWFCQVVAHNALMATSVGTASKQKHLAPSSLDSVFAPFPNCSLEKAQFGWFFCVSLIYQTHLSSRTWVGHGLYLSAMILNQ